MADPKDWSTSSNDAVHVRLKHAESNVKDVQFQPTFTYPIFGDEETIFGYRGLKIRLDYTADTLQPSLNVTSQAQFEPVGDTKPDDVEGKLKPLLPALRDTPEGASSAPAQSDPNWKPPGELMHQYESNGKSFGIWSTTLTEPRAKELLRNMQIFVLFFIEGGSCIELDDPDWTMARWRVFFVYSIGSSPANPNNLSYSFVGYSTSYTLFFLDTEGLVDPSIRTSKPDDDIPSLDNQSLQDKLPCRSRISQFVILPPYQGSGHGAHLYNTMIEHFLGQQITREITVEDPNESFDDLRDYCDILRLRHTNPAFASLSIDTSVSLKGGKNQPLPSAALLDPNTLLSIRKTSKIAPRQFSRLAEMQLLSRIPQRNRHLARLTRKDKATDPNDRAYYFWRLLVKQRLYKHNLDQLAQLELDERVEKLEETLQGLERDYLRILDGADKRAARIAEAIADGSKNGASPSNGSVTTGVVPASVNGASGGRLKRKLPDDDSDEDAEESDEAEGDDTVPAGGKRAKLGA